MELLPAKMLKFWGSRCYSYVNTCITLDEVAHVGRLSDSHTAAATGGDHSGHRHEEGSDFPRGGDIDCRSDPGLIQSAGDGGLGLGRDCPVVLGRW